MSEPIVFISHFRIRAGKLDPFERVARDVTQRLEAEKPRTLLFAAYRDEGGTRATFVHVFADADSMDRHFEGAEERSRAAYEFLALPVRCRHTNLAVPHPILFSVEGCSAGAAERVT
jgi:quinol monooxygenase YgiN